MEQLEAGYRAEEKGAWFEELKMFLPGEESSRSYAEVAARTGKGEDAIKMAVSRLRKQYGARLRAEIQRTMNDPSGVEEELRCLLAALSS
jgi:hypothetical protein